MVPNKARCERAVEEQVPGSGRPGEGSCFDGRIARSSLGNLTADDVQAVLRTTPLEIF
jgi:hypothetical protein